MSALLDEARKVADGFAEHRSFDDRYVAALIRSLCEALGEAQKDAERYAQVRTWTPVLFASAWEANLKTGKPFDEIVDHLKPFRDARGRHGE